MRGATKWSRRMSARSYFNPRSSCEERLQAGSVTCNPFTFQSTLLMRGATLQRTETWRARDISIHAPHARSDKIIDAMMRRFRHFNPRSSCEERRVHVFYHSTFFSRFQSTLLMRGATSGISANTLSKIHFNPRSSCEERRSPVRFYPCHHPISIHAPHARSDCVTFKH